MKKLRCGFKLYLLAMAAAGSSLLSAATFANYYAENTIQGKMSIAKWDFDASMSEVGGGTGVYTLPLEDVSGMSATNTIAPGSSGSFNIRFYKGESKTKQYYKIMTDRTDLPGNLKLYTDAACTTELTDEMEFDESIATLTLYWKWLYTDDNENVWQEKDIKAVLLVQVYQRV